MIELYRRVADVSKSVARAAVVTLLDLDCWYQIEALGPNNYRISVGISDVTDDAFRSVIRNAKDQEG